MVNEIIQLVRLCPQVSSSSISRSGYKGLIGY